MVGQPTFEKNCRILAIIRGMHIHSFVKFQKNTTISSNQMLIGLELKAILFSLPKHFLYACATRLESKDLHGSMPILLNFRFLWKSSKVHDALPNVWLTLPNFFLCLLLTIWTTTLGSRGAKHFLASFYFPKSKAIEGARSQLSTWLTYAKKGNNAKLESWKLN